MKPNNRQVASLLAGREVLAEENARLRDALKAAHDILNQRRTFDADVAYARRVIADAVGLPIGTLTA